MFTELYIPPTPEVALPDNYNLKEWVGHPLLHSTAQLLSSKRQAYGSRIHIREPKTITNICTWVETAGATLVNAHCALYQDIDGDGDLDLLGQTADQAAAWAGGTGLFTMAIAGGPVALKKGFADVIVWVEDWATAPTLTRAITGALKNVGLAGVNLKYFITTDNALTNAAPATLGTKSDPSGPSLWFALS